MKLPMKTKFLSSFFLNLIIPSLGLIYFESSFLTMFCFIIFHLGLSFIFLAYLFSPFSLFVLKSLLASHYLLFLICAQMTLIQKFKLQSNPSLKSPPIYDFNASLGTYEYRQRYHDRQSNQNALSLISLFIITAISFIPNALLYHHVFYKTYTFYEVKNFDQFPNLLPSDLLLIEVKPALFIPSGKMVAFVCLDLAEKIVIGRLIADHDQSKQVPLTIENHKLSLKSNLDAQGKNQALSTPISITLPTRQFDTEMLKFDFFWESIPRNASDLALATDSKYIITMDKYPPYPFHLPKIELASYEYLVLPDYRKFDERQGLCFGKVHEKQILGQVHSIVDQKTKDQVVQRRIGMKF